jgi:hypothetical protein
MRHLFALVLSNVVLLSITNFAVAQQHTFNTFSDVQVFMQSYYQHPQPQLISSLIEALDSSGFLRKSTTAPGVTGFFSEIFASNPDQISKWQVLIAKREEQTRTVLNNALTTSKTGGVLKLSGHSAQLNDAYWGAFFASGNPKYVDKLVDQLQFFDEREDAALFFAGGTAKWSLASNAKTYPAVRSAIEESKLKANKRTQELITDLLTSGPATVKRQMVEIYRTQKESGKWQ